MLFEWNFKTALNDVIGALVSIKIYCRLKTKKPFSDHYLIKKGGYNIKYPGSRMGNVRREQDLVKRDIIEKRRN